ncbi:MAG: DUF2993 domain-containing protein [Synechococcaceae cyanobacterium SM2_3_2]|nr:DUF2993 domain-containing protein [Synechococcaceae cyanobacterium SM2_3_2]
MDILAGLLALWAGLGGTGGYLANQTARQLLLDQLDRAEVLEVRVESIPNTQLLAGQADRVLIAARGLYRQPFPRVDVFELETDPIFIDLGSLTLNQPLQAAARIVIRVDDLNQALQSPEVLAQFEDIEADLPFASGYEGQGSLFDLRDPVVAFLPNQQVRLSAVLVEKNLAGEDLDQLKIEFIGGIEVESGQTLRLVDPEFIVGSVPVPREIAGAFLGGLTEVLDLRELDQQGITLRVLQLELNPNQLQVIAFVRIDTLPEALSD